MDGWFSKDLMAPACLKAVRMSCSLVLRIFSSPLDGACFKSLRNDAPVSQLLRSACVLVPVFLYGPSVPTPKNQDLDSRYDQHSTGSERQDRVGAPDESESTEGIQKRCRFVAQSFHDRAHRSTPRTDSQESFVQSRC